MQAVEEIQKEGIPHGDIWVGFTPDEEVGRGAELFDLDYFKADFAYTVDGGYEGEIAYENFNAASAEFVIHGVNVHPGAYRGQRGILSSDRYFRKCGKSRTFLYCA